MDTPLLALTRAGSLDGSSPDTTAIRNMRQLAQLRWFAVMGQVATILVAAYALGVALPLVPMLSVAALLGLANIAGAAWLASGRRVTAPALLLALLIDIGALTVQLYCSGGPTNPFISLYLLQVVLGAILLERASAWVLVAVTSLCFAGLTLRHLPLVYPARLLADRADLYTLGALVSFVLTGALLGLFVTRIIRNLRARDRYLADLRQQAAEEDGIVRMGLFASGAAHELGTPLASLAVILNDWARLPLIGADADLAAELADMQAEVARCKTIVTDILHAAGEPRGEAMGSVGACDFLDGVAAAWRSAHAGVPFEFRRDRLEGAAVVASASLRQALWNLLDNAAEASPRSVAMIVSTEPDGVRIAVLDRGTGFTPAQLALVGKPQVSGKGEGHGVGLFLAAHVARRLGGRLTAANRDGGGAVVTLVLPLVADHAGGN